ncbi:MAG: hypothetical protein FWE62_06250, partial [Firmicutes bacterium]|nr:hypothetical protein [Bacillota bacterium]
MIVLICVVCLLMFADGAMPTRTRGFTGAATAAVSYAAMNMLLAYGVVTEIDADYKTVVKGAALGAGILAILMGAVILSANLAGATNAAMPMLTLAEYANLSFFSRILLLTAIFTTLACAAFPLAKSVGRIVGNFKIAAAVVLAAGFALSFAGFEKIVKYFYPVTGIFGVVLICAALLHLYNTKNTARDDRVLGRISKS